MHHLAIKGRKSNFWKRKSEMKKPSKFKQGSVVSYVAHVFNSREREKKNQQGTTAASRHLLINKK